MTRKRIVGAAAIVLALLIAGGAALVVRATFFKPKTISAYFTTATAIYPGDDVRVSGVKVGRITSIQSQDTRVKIVMSVDPDVPIPADAKAVIVAANLIAARYVELAPAYRSSGANSGGPRIADGAVIPIERTAVPVEWDEIKAQLMRLATDLGPSSQVSTPSVARFIDSAADALGGNGDKLRQTLAQLSGVGRILADGSGNIVDIIKNLQTFVTALADSDQEILQFQDRFATLTSVLDDNRSDLDAALKNLPIAVGDVQRFIAETRDKTSEQIQRLADVTSNLVEHRKDLEQVLHVAPNAMANSLAEYDPDTGTVIGSVSLTNFSNPVQFFCAEVGAIENTTAPETAKLCAQYLGPALRLLSFNNLPFPINPYLAPAANNIIYTDPNLAPGGTGGQPVPPETPPAVSAYTGLNGDTPAPPGWNAPAPPPGQYTPLPAFPSPAVYPGAPPPPQPSVEGMLLPDQSPPLPPATPPEGQAGPLQPSAGTPPS